MKRMMSCVAGLACCCLIALPSAHTQAGKSRVVESAGDTGPVEVVGLSIAGQEAGVSDKVVAGKDWLKSLTLKFKNKHTRSIVHLNVELEVEKVGNMQYPLRLPMRFGERPTEPPPLRSSESPERIAPGREKELTLSDGTHDFLVQFMRENQVDDIEKVKVFIEIVIYDDDTAWGKGGHLLLRDPNNPQRWVVKGIWQGGRVLFYGPKSSPPGSDRPRKVAATDQCNSPPYRAPALYTPAKITTPLLTSHSITARFFPAIGLPIYRGSAAMTSAIDDVLPMPTCVYWFTDSPEP